MPWAPGRYLVESRGAIVAGGRQNTAVSTELDRADRAFNLVLFLQVRDEYRTDYDPDILLHFSLTISKVLQYVFYVMMVLIFLEVRRG